MSKNVKLNLNTLPNSYSLYSTTVDEFMCLAAVGWIEINGTLQSKPISNCWT